jgi:hypothetical protein
MPAPTVDGSSHGVSTSPASCTATLTTTQADDIIVIMAYNEFQNSGAGAAVASVTGAGLTFAQRSHSNSSAHGSMEWWWAHAPSPLTAQVFTVAWAAAYDDAIIFAYGINGCGNLAAPFDPNVSLPAIESFPGGGLSNPSLSGVSTTNADTLLLTAIGSVNVSVSAPSGWTGGQQTGNGGGVEGCSMFSAYNGVTAPQSGITVAWIGSLVGPWNAAEMIVDALSGAAASPAKPFFGTAPFGMIDAIPPAEAAAIGISARALRMMRENPTLRRRDIARRLLTP